MPKKALDAREFCQKYAISRSTFYREVAAGHLRGVKKGRKTLIPHTETKRWLQNIKKAQKVGKRTRLRMTFCLREPTKHGVSVGAHLKLFFRRWK